MAPISLLSLLGTAAAMKCPGSSSWIHASAEVQAMAEASCADVSEEIKARVSGGWKDPHNGGTYTLLDADDGELTLQRVTANGKFTDKMIFTLSSFHSARASCGIHACSESQGFSVKDFSTNYCNLRNLYCGSTEGCVPVKHDFETSEEEVTPSWFGGSDKDACIVKSEAETALATVATVATPMLRQVPVGGTVEDTLGCVSNNCPMDKATLQPSAMCILGNCTSNLAKCLFSSTCRSGVMCELGCFDLLKATDSKEDADRFVNLMDCMRTHCPGYPPSKTCVAMHCVAEAGACAFHSTCRSALECADGCVPAKYAAALAAAQQATEVVTEV